MPRVTASKEPSRKRVKKECDEIVKDSIKKAIRNQFKHRIEEFTANGGYPDVSAKDLREMVDRSLEFHEEAILMQIDSIVQSELSTYEAMIAEEEEEEEEEEFDGDFVDDDEEEGDYDDDDDEEEED